MVTAKFIVNTIDLIVWGGWPGQEKTVARRVNMSAVKSEPFGSATPHGSIAMTIVNPDAARQFDLDAEYEVTFTRVSEGISVNLATD